MTTTLRMSALLLAGTLTSASCAEAPSIPTSAFATPIDFTYACPGVSNTEGVSYDGTGSQEVFCDKTVAGNQFGRVLGLVLNQDPGGVLLMSIAATDAGTAQGGEVVDSDPFIPGFTSIRVPDKPIRLLRASDWRSFYIISAGEPAVSKLVVRGFSIGDDTGQPKVIASCDRSSPGLPCYDLTTFALPGTPSNGVIYGNSLVVSAAWSNEVWKYDLTAETPSPTSYALPGTIDQISPLKADGVAERLVVTWAERGVVSLLDGDLQILDEQPVTAACADGLDNDGDGLADNQDPDCYGATDDDESATPAAPAVAVTEPAAAFVGANFCNDGIDNDGNGLTDAEEGTGPGERCENPDGEGLAECEDGIDNDGDGAVDTADTSCYSAAGTLEGALGPFGGYQVAVVEAGAAGTFAYVSDPRRSRLAAYALEGDTLVRQDVNGFSSVAPGLVYTTLSREDEVLPDVVTTAFPGLVHAEQKDLALAPLLSMAALRVRGQLWQHDVAPSIPLSAGFDPGGCVAGELTTVCERPDADGETYWVFLPRLDGEVQMLESVVRGVPRHRFVQDLRSSQRQWNLAGNPTLTLRGDRRTNFDDFSLPGQIGGEETVDDPITDVQPQLDRESGFRPPDRDDIEQVPTQTWAITYEGALPQTDGTLGRLVSTTDFYAPGQRFCELGAQVDDWLVLTVPTAASDPLVHFDSVLTVAGGTCALEPLETTMIEARITSVGQDTLTVDPTTARLVPQDRELDEAAIREGSTNILNACQDALKDYTEDLLMGDGADAIGFIGISDQWQPALLPPRVSYVVRPAGEWTVVGGKTGYAHRWSWDGATCVEDTTLDPRHTGRLTTKTFGEIPYASCPVDAEEELTLGKMTGEPSFTNFSFSFYMMPGCRGEGANTAFVSDRRDTRWAFAVEGPDRPDTTRTLAGALPRRLGTMETGRAIVYMDSASNRFRLFRFWHGTNVGETFSRLFD